MSKTSRLALAAGACLLAGSAAMAQNASPATGTDATGTNGKALTANPTTGTSDTGMDGKALNGGPLSNAGSGGAGNGLASGAAKPTDAPVGLQPSSGTGTKAP